MIVSRNYEIDSAALSAVLENTTIACLGMIGSRRKVSRVWDTLKQQGASDEDLSRVYAPMGLDIGSDSPAEIAISVMAEILKVKTGAGGDHLSLNHAQISSQ